MNKATHMIKLIRRMVGNALRNAGWERSINANPRFIGNALGHKLYPSELGVIYKQYNNRRMADYTLGAIAYVNQTKSDQTVLDIGGECRILHVTIRAAGRTKWQGFFL